MKNKLHITYAMGEISMQQEHLLLFSDYKKPECLQKIEKDMQ